MTIDCAALTIKSGNAIVLRGSSYAERSNAALAAIVREGLAAAGLPEDAVSLLAGGGREDLAELATQDGLVDLLDPAGRRGAEGGFEGRRDRAGDVRGGRQLPRLRSCRRRPGDGAADCRQREGAASRGLQRGRDAAASTRRSPTSFVPAALADLREAGVELFGDERVRALAVGVEVGAATAQDWDTEYLDLKMAVGSGRLPRRSDRSHQRSTAAATPRRSSPPRGRRRSASSPRSTPPPSTSTHLPASPMASSTGWAPRSATRPRSCTPGGRSGCGS